MKYKVNKFVVTISVNAGLFFLILHKTIIINTKVKKKHNTILNEEINIILMCYFKYWWKYIQPTSTTGTTLYYPFSWMLNEFQW